MSREIRESGHTSLPRFAITTICRARNSVRRMNWAAVKQWSIVLKVAKSSTVSRQWILFPVAVVLTGVCCFVISRGLTDLLQMLNKN